MVLRTISSILILLLLVSRRRTETRLASEPAGAHPNMRPCGPAAKRRTSGYWSKLYTKMLRLRHVLPARPTPTMSETPTFYFSMRYTCVSLRRKIARPDTAGEARKRPSNSFSAIDSNVRPGFTTVASPPSLTK